MNAALRRGVVSGIFAGGFVLLGVTTATSASADTGDPGLALAGSTNGSDGVGSGNQTDIDLDAPLRAVGNQVTVVGKDNQNHSTTAGAPAAPSPRPTPTGSDTSGEDGVLSGNQTTVAACVPITADGNQVTVVGDGNHGTSGGSHDACESVTVGEADESSGDGGVGSGNQTSVEVCVPVTLSGNQLTGVGDGNHASSEGSGAACGTGERTSDQTSGDDGLLSGNQTSLDVCVPVTATGNQLTVIGDDNQSSSSGGGSSCGEGAAGGGTPGDTSGEDGLGSGNQTALDPNVPVDVIGNQVTVIGEGNSNESASSGGAGGAGGSGTGDTSGEDGTGSGNQTVLDVLAPVDATGNQVTVIGEGNSNESTSSGAGAGAGGGAGDTSGEDGTGSGNQTVVVPSVPVDAVGNQVTVIGEGNSNESTSSGAGAGAGGSATGDTSGEDGTGSGNQTVVVPSVPVDAVGNQVTVIGEGNSNESTSSGAGAGAGGGAGDTSGEDGTASGNQTVVDPSVPVEVEANQITVIGDDNTNDSTEEGPGEDPGDDPGEDPNDPGEDPGDGNGDGGGDGPGEGPGGQDGGDGSPGDTDVMPGQARAGALVAAPRAPSEVQAGLQATAPTTTSPSSPVLPLLMLLLGALCVALAGRRLSAGRT